MFFLCVLISFFILSTIHAMDTTDSSRNEDTLNQPESAIMNLSALNTPQSDFAPFIMPDGKTIYFSSSRPNGYGGEDIYITRWDGYRWLPPQNLGMPPNSSANEGSMAISQDGTEMFITICGRTDSYGECDIYISQKKGDKWSEARNVAKNINSSWWDGHPTLTPSGDTLFFASNRFGGYGGLDIYFSVRTEKGWSKAENLGYPINNARDQTSPYMAVDGKTLYFSSSGHGGLGGLDVFFTRIDSVTGKWTEPVNLGPPINTSGNDYFFSIPASGELIFFSSDRAPGYGGFDIYTYPLALWQRPQVVAIFVGKVVDSETGNPIQADVEIERLADGTHLQSIKTDSTGAFTVVLQAGETYALSASAPGYTFSSEQCTVEAKEGYRELSYVFKLTPVKVGGTVELHNIFFDFAKADLRPESISELERVAELMRKYPDMQIEVAGYADSIGTEEFNLFLSTERAKKVAEWLTANGIHQKRIKYKGYGEANPVGENALEEGRQLNRRVEFKILEK